MHNNNWIRANLIKKIEENSKLFKEDKQITPLAPLCKKRTRQRLSVNDVTISSNNKIHENKKKKSKNETKICSKVNQELFMNAIKKYCTVNNVKQNGYCGYIAIINGLKEYNINHESATEFRELIHDHINENKSSIYDNMKFSTPISKNNLYQQCREVFIMNL